MALASGVCRNDYLGDGSTEVYAYGFKIYDESELLVIVRDTDDVETTLTLTTDYTVDGVRDSDGGEITLVDDDQDWLDAEGDLKTGYTLTIRRILPYTQTTDIRNQGTFYPETHEDALDRIVMLVQQLANDVAGAIKLPQTVDPADYTMRLPVLTGQAGKLVAVNATEDGFELVDP